MSCARHHVLSVGGGRADPSDPQVVQLVPICGDHAGVSGLQGLAAPQIGVSTQAFCVDVSAHPKARTSHGLIVLVNAEIVEASRNEKGREGCMSVPELTGDVKRATLITTAGQLPGTGDDIEITTDAFEARALQHEIDHCAGLLLDRVAGAHAVHARKVYRDPPAP